jgi:hypothetical protein
MTLLASGTNEQNRYMQKLQRKLPKTLLSDYSPQLRNSPSELYPQKLTLEEKQRQLDNSTQNHETTAAYARRP